MSGGFDSARIKFSDDQKRCARTHYCFFNLRWLCSRGWRVKQVSYYLWNKFGASHRVKFFAVDFEPVVAEILRKSRKRSNGC